jgi:hypothetical protein
MGQSGIFKCLVCGHEFHGSDGGGFHFNLYRCVDCDTTKSIFLNMRGKQVENIGKCPCCGGKLRQNLTPMCPNCHERKTMLKDLQDNYD